MRLEIVRRVLAASLGTLLLFFTLATDAGARDKRGAEPGGLEDVVEAIDLTNRTVTIAGQKFVVSDSSRLLNARGGRIHLRELRDDRTTGNGDMVEYWIRRGDGPPEIRRLRILEGDFE